MEKDKTITAVTIKKPDRTEIEISLDDVRRYLCPNASLQEIALFLKTCQSEGLDPWAKEIYLIKYDQKSPASMVVSVDTYLKTAEGNNNYKGHEAGIILKDTAGKLEFREGSFLLPEEEGQLAGGWAKVYRDDREKTFYAAVPISEYRKYAKEGRPSRLWNEMPASMIRKVALSHALKEAFPNRYSGIYTTAEFEPVPEVEPAAEAGVAEGQLPPAFTAKEGEPDWTKFWAKQSERGVDGSKAHSLLGVASIKKDLMEKQGKTFEEIDEMITNALAQEKTVGVRTPIGAAAPIPSPSKGEEADWDDLPPSTEPPAKPASQRDPSTIKNFNDLYKACFEDYGMQPVEVVKELGHSTQTEITQLPSDCYLQIKAARG